MKDFEKHKASLEKEKERIRLKEKLLREKQKQKRAKGFEDIGRLASKVDIDLIEKNALLGAFIEISERSSDEKVMTGWREKGECFQNKEQLSDQVPLSICFKASPPKEAKEKLKNQGFRWNTFRKEFCGYGSKNALQKLLHGFECNIEVLN